MDYKEKYEQALEKARTIVENQNASSVWKDWLCNTFPELKSEDEKAKEEIKQLIQCMHDADPRKERWLAWLEKQGEQKPVISNNALREGIAHFGITQYQIDNWLKKYVDVEKQGEQNLADKVEPEFHEGDWVVSKVTGSIYQIENCIENLSNHKYGYDLMNGGYINTNEVNRYRLWTIQDAKDGDVLVEDSCIFIIQKLGDNSTAAKTYCTLYNDGDFDDGSILYFDIDSTKPATKEQRDALERAMINAGYRWNKEELKLEKI